MPNESIGWSGVLLRVVSALVLVFLTWNAEGWSYYHWTIEPLLRGDRSFDAVKFLAGMLLVAGWVVFLQATRRSIGIMGAVSRGRDLRRRDLAAHQQRDRLCAQRTWHRPGGR